MSNTILAYLKTWSPVSDRVLVLPKEQENVLGILTSDTGQGNDKEIRGEIIAVGKGRRGENGELIPMESKVGDQVILGRYAGDDFLVDEDLTITKYEGVKRDDQVFVTVLRQDSLLITL